ncbi:MAG: Crp/Fnr family transcriptional regulator [Bacteroidota bacterium]
MENVPDPADALRQYIQRYITLGAEEFACFYEYLEVAEFEKHAYLHRAGSICRHRYFLLEGLVRTYYTDAKGNDRITLFGKELWWVTEMDSFITEAPSQVHIQALEKTKALAISKAKLEEVFEKIPSMERFFRIITEKWLIAQLRNSHFYMKASSKDRYQFLVSSIPNFVQRVPQYMIASYLDITPEYLSELRKAKA